jgi:ABC-type lipoprotein release transport system permease subunit
MSGILFGVEPGDPLTIVFVIGAVGLTAIVASVSPLRRAVVVSPAETLRAE